MDSGGMVISNVHQMNNVRRETKKKKKKEITACTVANTVKTGEGESTARATGNPLT